MASDGAPMALLSVCVRAMRPIREKFEAWAATVPHTIGNPLYHWTHLEPASPIWYYR
ncbi:glucuronate isomerase [Citrobacter koseri]|nr:glucuronate isomerase [Citrobacter koseri]